METLKFIESRSVRDITTTSRHYVVRIVAANVEVRREFAEEDVAASWVRSLMRSGRRDVSTIDAHVDLIEHESVDHCLGVSGVRWHEERDEVVAEVDFPVSTSHLEMFLKC